MSDSIFGNIEFRASDNPYPPVPYDRLAHSPTGELLFVSLVSHTQIVKGIRAILNANASAKSSIKASGGKTCQATRESWVNPTHPGDMYRGGVGYAVDTHRLSYGNAHAFIRTRSPGFLSAISEPHLWFELNSVRFTTPLLRPWMPHITRELRSRSLLIEAFCYRCECGILKCTTADLDSIVSDGIKDGSLTLQLERMVA